MISPSIPDSSSRDSFESNSQSSKKQELSERSVYMANPSEKPIPVPLLNEKFSQFGKVEKTVFDKEWQRYAIVQFSSKEEAERALKVGRIEVNGEILTLKKAKLKEDPIFFQQDINSDQIIKVLSQCPTSCLIDQIDVLRKEFGIDHENHTLRIRITRFLEKHFLTYFAADVKVKLFGSSVTGLGTKFADVDLNFLVFKNERNSIEAKRIRTANEFKNVSLSSLIKEKILWEEYQQLDNSVRQDLVYRILQDIHHRIGVISNIKCIKSKVPVVCFIYQGELFCELSIGNEFSEEKANLIINLIKDKNGVLTRLLFFLRLWAQINGIFGFDSSTKPTSLKSYAFSLLFIAYLQESKLVNPVKVNGNRLINDWIVDYEHQYPDVEIDNKTIGNLISGFFIFLSQKLKEDQVVCIRDGELYSWNEFEGHANRMDDRILEKFERNVINIQDPLELSHNVAGSVGRKLLSLLRTKCNYALAKRKLNPSSILILFEQNEKDEPENGFGFKVFFEKNHKDQNVIESMRIILEDILKMESQEEISCKRRKIEGEEGYFSQRYSTRNKIWLGRRTVLRKLKSKYPNDPIWRIEKMVSQEIEKSPEHIVFEVRIDIEYNYFDGFLLVKIEKEKSDSDQTVTDFCHFLEQFISKNDFSLLRSIINFRNTDGIQEKMELMEVDG